MAQGFTKASGSTSLQVYEDGASVLVATRIDAKDSNIEDAGSNVAHWYHNLPGIAGGRLTLTSGTPVTTGDVTGAGTIYYTPYIHDKISLYDGTRWKVYTFTERSLALTLTSGKNYDVFLYDNSGTLTLELSAAWTNDTTRADAVTTQNGVYVKSGATTRRLVGTIRASGANTTEDSTDRRFVWNMNNRVKRSLYAVEDTGTNSWTYTTATWRAVQNLTTVGLTRVEMVFGLNEDLVVAMANSIHSNASNTTVASGIGVDSTSANSAIITGSWTNSDGDSAASFYRGYPGVGYHYLQWLEISRAVGGTTWYGDTSNNDSWMRSGMMAEVMA